LLFDDTAPIRVDIIDGRVDVNEDGLVNNADDLTDVDLNRKSYIAIGNRFNDQVDIKNGLIDVNEDGIVNGADDVRNVTLLVP
jgi:hypothetical protein